MPTRGTVIKGPVQKSGGDRAEHIDREPPCNAQFNELMSSCCSVDFPTHSILQQLPPTPSNATLKTMFDNKKAEALEAFDKIVAACESSGNDKKFFDKEFFLGSRQSLYPDGSPADCTIGEPQTIIRAEDFYQAAPLFDGSANGDVDSDDIRQGQAGNCFLISAITGIATYITRFAAARKRDSSLPENFSGVPDPIHRTFIAENREKSVYALMFNANGQWEWVIVDGTLAGREDGQPLYASCGEQERELWPVLLEKGFAKLHKSFDLIDGGFSAQAVATLTGGNQLYVDNTKQMKWSAFLSMGNNPLVVMNCAVRNEIQVDPDAEGGRCGELAGPRGLIKGHAYSVLKVQESSDKKLKAVLLMNPWQSAEWQGDWSDPSELWKKFPIYAREFGHADKDDGCFWMSAGDFHKYMELEAVNFFPDSNQVLTLGNTFVAGDKTSDHTYIVKIDGNPASVRFVLGQYAERFAPALLGESATNHVIGKGRGQWDKVTGRMLLTVNHHSRGCPTAQNFSSSSKTKVGFRDGSWTDSVWCDVDCKEGYYLSMCPQFAGDNIPYYVRAIAPPGTEVTVFQLSKGLEGAVGKTEGVEIQHEEKEETTAPEAAASDARPPSPEDKPQQVITVEEIAAPPAAEWEDDLYAGDDGEDAWAEIDFNAMEAQLEEMASELEKLGDGGDENADPEAVAARVNEMAANIGAAIGGEAGAEIAEAVAEATAEVVAASAEEQAAREQEDEELLGGADISDDQLYQMFCAFDDDLSGELDRAEATAALVYFFPDESAYQIQRRIRQADVNCDGRLQFEEFKSIARDVFASPEDDDDDDSEYGASSSESESGSESDGQGGRRRRRRGGGGGGHGRGRRGGGGGGGKGKRGGGRRH